MSEYSEALELNQRQQSESITGKDIQHLPPATKNTHSLCTDRSSEETQHTETFLVGNKKLQHVPPPPQQVGNKHKDKTKNVSVDLSPIGVEIRLSEPLVHNEKAVSSLQSIESAKKVHIILRWWETCFMFFPIHTEYHQQRIESVPQFNQPQPGSRCQGTVMH